MTLWILTCTPRQSYVASSALTVASALPAAEAPSAAFVLNSARSPWTPTAAETTGAARTTPARPNTASPDRWTVLHQEQRGNEVKSRSFAAPTADT